MCASKVLVTIWVFKYELVWSTSDPQKNNWTAMSSKIYKKKKCLNSSILFSFLFSFSHDGIDVMTCHVETQNVTIFMVQTKSRLNRYPKMGIQIFLFFCYCLYFKIWLSNLWIRFWFWLRLNVIHRAHLLNDFFGKVSWMEVLFLKLFRQVTSIFGMHLVMISNHIAANIEYRGFWIRGKGLMSFSGF